MTKFWLKFQSDYGTKYEKWIFYQNLENPKPDQSGFGDVTPNNLLKQPIDLKWFQSVQDGQQ